MKTTFDIFYDEMMEEIKNPTTIPYESPNFLLPAHKALTRMKKAYDTGRGCKLSAEEIESLSLTVVGSLWEQPGPDNINIKQHPE